MLRSRLSRMVSPWFLAAALAACDGTAMGVRLLRACTGSGPAVSLSVGQYTALDPEPDSGCAVFPANASGTSQTEYLLVPQAATGVPGDFSSFQLTGGAAGAAALLVAGSPVLTPAARFHGFLRQSEEARWYGVAPGGPLQATSVAAVVSAAAKPQVGDTGQFWVCGGIESCTPFQRVTAVARAVGEHLAIFVDVAAPAPPKGLDSLDLDSLKTVFDARLYPVDTAAFGRESDINGDSVVIVLMTTVVNKMVTAQQCKSMGFIAGFFFGFDIDPLAATHPNSNRKEIFYALVADPDSTLSCAHTRDAVKRLVPVTFVHEFQHMISFNEHVLVRGGQGEVLWLNEGLSHFAEELGGRTYPPGSTEFSRFTVGNLLNAYKFLDSTFSHFLLPSTGFGTLAERGAQWLFVRYLVDQYGGTTDASRNAFTQSLVRTSLRGAQNVTNATGAPSFQTPVTSWALANWVSDLNVAGFTPPPELRYTSWQFRTTFQQLHTQFPAFFPKPFPLTPAVSAGDAVNLAGVLHAGSGTYHRVVQDPGGASFTLLFSEPIRLLELTIDPEGRGVPLRASLVPRLNVVRIR